MATTAPPARSRESQLKILHNVALGVVIVCPLIIALPPRKFDVYTTLLISCTAIGANQLLHDATGRSFVRRWNDSLQGLGTPALPEKAQMLKELREKRVAETLKEKTGEDGKVLKALEEQMGKRDWKVERDERERRYLEEGKGYGDLIKDQIWEVWNWDRKGADDKPAQSKDEK